MGRDSNQLQQFRANRDYVSEEITRLVKKLYDVEHYIGQAINKKRLLKKAGKPVLDKLRVNSPVDEGNLRNSMAFLNFKKDKQAVYVGPRYHRAQNSEGEKGNAIGPHAHLVEYGFIDRSGKRVEGKPFIKQTYEQTRLLVLNNLNNEIQKLIDKKVSGR